MNCIRCGKPLDAEALELGACQYCGQTIQVRPFTAQLDPGPVSGQGPKSIAHWQDWPATTSPAAGAAHPSLPKLNAPDASPAWSSANDADDDRTELGSLLFAPGAVPPPGTDPFAPEATVSGTAPFVPQIPAPPIAPSPAQQPMPPPVMPPYLASNAPPFTGMAAAPVYPPAAPARPQRRRTLILAAVAAFVVVALIVGGLLFARGFPTTTNGAGASATSKKSTPAASPTATLPTTQVYRDPNGRFTISYPIDWKEQHTSQKLGLLPITLDGAQFQGGNASLKILSGEELPLVPNQAAQADTALLQLMGGHTITSADSKRIGGQTWTTKQAIADNGNKLVAASITYQSELYSIVYSAPSAEFSQDEAQTFTPMLDSFAFGA